MTALNETRFWTSTQAFILATVLLFVGVAVGYVSRGGIAAAASKSTPPIQIAPVAVAPESHMPASHGNMKDLGAAAISTLLEKLKADPKNGTLLVQIAELYYHDHSYAEAATYYKRAVEVDPNPALRNKYASTLFQLGDGDQALAEYEKVLSKSPDNDVALFNAGLVRYKVKNDPSGAVAMWQKLLKAHPNHPQREQVERMIEKAKAARG